MQKNGANTSPFKCNDDANYNSGEIRLENHFGSEETYTCMHGDGRNYVGTSKKTIFGHKCIEGTECRNPTPEINARTYCNASQTHQFEDCLIIDCSERFAPFAGHRGSIGWVRNESFLSDNIPTCFRMRSKNLYKKSITVKVAYFFHLRNRKSYKKGT